MPKKWNKTDEYWVDPEDDPEDAILRSIYTDEYGRKFVDRLEGEPDQEDVRYIHPVGGGLVKNPDNVDQDVYVGPRASVIDNAQVRHGARLEGTTLVMSESVITGPAIIEDAIITGGSVINGHVYIKARSGETISGVEIGVIPNTITVHKIEL